MDPICTASLTPSILSGPYADMLKVGGIADMLKVGGICGVKKSQTLTKKNPSLFAALSETAKTVPTEQRTVRTVVSFQRMSMKNCHMIQDDLVTRWFFLGQEKTCQGQITIPKGSQI